MELCVEAFRIHKCKMETFSRTSRRCRCTVDVVIIARMAVPSVIKNILRQTNCTPRTPGRLLSSMRRDSHRLYLYTKATAQSATMRAQLASSRRLCEGRRADLVYEFEPQCIWLFLWGSSDE